MEPSLTLRYILSALFIALPYALRADDSVMGTETLYGVTTPPLRSRAEVESVLAKAPKPRAEAALRPLTILIAGGA